MHLRLPARVPGRRLPSSIFTIDCFKQSNAKEAIELAGLTRWPGGRAGRGEQVGRLAMAIEVKGSTRWPGGRAGSGEASATTFWHPEASSAEAAGEGVPGAMTASAGTLTRPIAAATATDSFIRCIGTRRR